MAKGINIAAPMGEQHRSNFSLGCRVLTTMDYGLLQPIKCLEVVPGDVISLNLKGFTMVAPNIAPITGDIMVDCHAFFVPNRILWHPWNEYRTNLKTLTLPWIYLKEVCGVKTSTTAVAAVNRNGCLAHFKESYNDFKNLVKVSQGLGLNPHIYLESSNDTRKINPFAFAAYNRIWWDWYRNSSVIGDDLAAQFGVNDDAAHIVGSNLHWTNENFFTPRYRCFGKDYMTSALLSPSGQSGSTNLIASAITGSDSGYNSLIVNDKLGGFNAGDFDTSIPQIRAANALQKWLETANFLGKRVISRIQGLLNGNATPERLDMSEYLGGGSGIVKFQNSTTSTSWSEDGKFPDNPFGYSEPVAGSMSGQSVPKGSADFNLSIKPYHVQEDGMIIVIASVMPKPQYSNQIPRMFFRGQNGGDIYDFYTPQFENLGFQPITYGEVVNPVVDKNKKTSPISYDPNKIWGYIPKYMDYKFQYDMIGGDFADPSQAVSAKNFTLERDFMREFGFKSYDQEYSASAAGKVFSDFVNVSSCAECTQQTRTVFDDRFNIGDDDLDHFNVDFKIDINASRPMVANNVPCLDSSEVKDNNKVVGLGGVRL